MYRRFGLLHTRILLHKQKEISKLERQLMLLDEHTKSAHGHILAPEDMPVSVGEEYNDILSRIEAKLIEYGIVRRFNNAGSVEPNAF